VDASAEDAWIDFVTKCSNERYDPKKTTPRECGTLSGNLCSREPAVKCFAQTTEFRKDGKVIATADHRTLRICDPSGACRAPRRAIPAAQAPGTSAGASKGGPCCKVDAAAEAAWRKYASSCVGDRYDPAKTSPAVCGGLTGDLCSRAAVVKCGPGKTQFLKDGKVIATGDDNKMLICDSKGACRS
jgi:hypothetical protein